MKLLACVCVFIFVKDVMLFNPKIDILDLSSRKQQNFVHPYCRTIMCPVYKELETNFTSRNIKLRQYEQSNWVATKIFPGLNNSCVDKSDAMEASYRSILTYFKGLNKKGLTIDRTLPVRVESRKDNFGRNMCFIRFYLPDLSPMQHPAPLFRNAYIGTGQTIRCYVIPRRGPATWSRIIKLHSNLVHFLKAHEENLEDFEFEESEIVTDIFSGFAVPTSLKYLEVLVCQSNKSRYYDW